MKKKILPGDDSKTSLFVEQMILKKHPYELILARDGVEGVAKAVSERPDLIQMVVVMPRMNGFEAVKEQRAREATRSIPLIMVTTRGEGTNGGAGLESGCTKEDEMDKYSGGWVVKTTRALVAASLACLAAGTAWAQVGNALMTGTVKARGGASLAGVAIVLVSKDTGLKREAVTGASGSYFLSLLPPGHYELNVALTGFRPFQIPTLTLEVGERRTLDIDLEPAAAAEGVAEVEEDQPRLERFSPEYGGVVRGDQLEALPLNGRQWSEFMVLAPGAQAGSSTSIRIFGRSTNDNNWTLDGVDATGVRQQPQDSSVRLVISLDAISEFRVSSSLYSANLGLGGGAQVQLVSKSGSNRWGGTLYDYLRNDAFDSPAFGDAGSPPPFQMNQFGASIGGPLHRDKTFFFFNYEGLRQTSEARYSGFVPSASFRSRTGAASPALVPFLRAYPVGTRSTGDPDVDEAVASRNSETNEDSFLVRLDHRFSARTSLMARYNMDRGVSKAPQNVGTALQTGRNRPYNFTMQLQQIFSRSLANTVSLALNRVAQDNAVAGYFDQGLTVPGLLTLTANSRTQNEGKSLGLLDEVTFNKGAHNLMAGGEVRRVTLDINNGPTTSLGYASRPDFLSNRLDTYSQNDPVVGQARRTYFSAYVQDDWKARFDLTLNFGLRYEYYSVMKATEGSPRVFDLACGGYCPPGTPFYKPDWSNFAPRVGFNWAPAWLGFKTVIRGGYGVYFGPGRMADLLGPLNSGADHFFLNRVQFPALSYPVSPSLEQKVGAAPQAIDASRRDGYVEQYGLSVQQQLPARVVLLVGYVGSEGHKLYSQGLINLIDPATGKRPLPAFSQVATVGSEGQSSFNGLQLSLQRHPDHGLSLGADYTLGYATDNRSVGAGDATAPQNASDRRAEIARSTRDVRHTGTLYWIYDLPGGDPARSGFVGHLLRGWQLTGLFQARSGRPLTVTITRRASDLPDGNNSGQRPDRVPGVPLTPPAGQTADLWINPAAFAVPAKGQWGNAGRSIIDGPALVQLDMGLRKRIPLSDSRNLEFRWDVFNVFNRIQLNNPSTNLSSLDDFGKITAPLNRTLGTGTSRQMQFMLRFNF